MIPSSSTVSTSSEDSITTATLLSALLLQPPLPPTSLYASNTALQAYHHATAGQIDTLHKSIEPFLPTRSWSKIPLNLQQALISEMKIQHGNLPSLQIKVIHGVDAIWQNELDQALLWLNESIGQPYPVIGLSVESDHASIRLLQLATSTRCVMIRIPDRQTLLAQATAAASIAASRAVNEPIPPESILFTPLFYELLSNRQIFKSGLEACTDALQLYQLFDFSTVHPSHPKFELNSGLNIAWNMMMQRRQNPNGLGLLGTTSGRLENLHTIENMVDGILGMKSSFKSDSTQTYTDWGCERLNLRQVVYAALNAQVAYIIACTQSLPTPFHLSDLPKSWILHAASWRELQLRQREILAAELMGMPSGEDEQTEAMKDVQALATLSELYFARFTQGEEPINPFISTLLQLGQFQPYQDPISSAEILATSMRNINPLSLEGSGLAIEATNPYWWFESVQPNEKLLGGEMLESVRGLDSLQKQVVQQVDQNRISIIEGGVGTGKTQVLVSCVLNALDRSSSIPLQRSSNSVRMSTQRVLIIAETAAALAITTMLAKYLPSDRIIFLMTQSSAAANSTPKEEETELIQTGYLQPITDDLTSSFTLDRDVLILQPDTALYHVAISRLLRSRQTLVLEDANQLWLLKSILLLRKLPHTERIILSGDSMNLQPIIAKSETESVLSTAISTTQSLTPITPIAFQPYHITLPTQYRTSPHLSTLLSSLFYRGTLKSDEKALSSLGGLARKKRAIGWVDVPATQAVLGEGGSWSNTQAETAALLKLWHHYLSADSLLSPSELAIIVFHGAARRELAANPVFGSRVFSPEDLIGQEVQVSFVCLSAPGVTHFLADGRRALVALSRAKYKVFILGDRDAIVPYHSIWKLVEEYCETDVSEEIRKAEIAALAKPPTPIIPEEEQVVPAPVATSEPSEPAVTSAVSTIPAIPTEDISRLANLYSLFISHTPPPHSGPLLIDNLGKFFKTRFGSSWKNYEKLDRDAKLINFLSKYPTLWRLQNMNESVHVNVEWIGSDEVVKYFQSHPNGARVLSTATTLDDEASPVLPDGIDPFGLESVITLDPSLPPADAELIDALFQTLLTTPGILLSDLSKSFKTLHKYNWQNYTDLKLGEFLRKYSPAYFKFKNNKDNTRNPIVDCVITGLIPEKIAVEPPKTVIASNAVAKEGSSGGRKSGGGSTAKSETVAAAAIHAPTPSAPVKSSSTTSVTSTASTVATGGDLFAQATALSSSVHASQIDDFFRLECLRLVFLHNQNCGLALTEIGNAFHALHGLRWKRLTKTDLRVSDFMYGFSPEYIEFDYENCGVDSDGNENPIVYFVADKLETPLFHLNATTTAAPPLVKSTSAPTKNEPKRQSSTGSNSATSTNANNKKQTSKEKESEKKEKEPKESKDSKSSSKQSKQPQQQAATAVPVVASPDDFQPVGRKGQSVKETSKEHQILCSFCQTIIRHGERVCPNCESLVEENMPPAPVEEPKPAQQRGKQQRGKGGKQPLPLITAPVPTPVIPPVVQAAPEPEEEPEEEESSSASVSPIPSPSPEPEKNPYLSLGLLESDYVSPAALEAMSKKERRKLSWLCPGCKGCNEQREPKCELCDYPKPKTEFLRYKNPVTQIILPPTVEKDNKKGSNANGTTPATSKTSSKDSASSSAPPASARYENEWVKISHTEEYGYHYVAKQFIPAGTNFLQDDVLWSSSAGALESAMGSCIPNESQFSELIMKLLRDPVMVQLLSNRNITQYAMIGKLLNLKKPKDVGNKEWSAGVEMTLTGAIFQREPAPGHSKSCNCSYGRFWMKRQSALLVHSCWPNCAHVKRPSRLKEAHSIIATQDIQPGTVLTDCMNSAIINLPRERRLQWITQTTGKPTCTCDRCKNPRKLDAQMTAVVPGTTQKVNAAKLEEDYEIILKQYSKLNSMGRTIPDDPAYSSPQHDERYFQANYDFLSSIHTFLTCYHSLSPLHWRKQYLRNLFVTLVAKNELFDVDLMHPDDRRLVQSSTTTSTSPTANSKKSPLRGRWTSPLNPSQKGYDERRSRNHWYLQMILTNVLAHLEANAQFFNSHEPLKCSAIFLMYSLIDWFHKEESENCVTIHTLADGTEVQTTCFNFTFDRRRKDLHVYLSDKLKELEPNAEDFFKANFPLRA